MGKSKIAKRQLSAHPGGRLRQTIAKNIIRYRDAKKLSQKQLAAILDLSQSALSNLENGKRSPSLETIENLAKALDINPAALLMSPTE